MIVLVLLFTPTPDGKIEIDYEVKITVKRTLEACQAAEKAFTEESIPNQRVIIVCKEADESEEGASLTLPKAANIRNSQLRIE